jgi:hypothetical protein
MEVAQTVIAVVDNSVALADPSVALSHMKIFDDNWPGVAFSSK